ncbi:MAG: GWxTD domain-containing protein [Candidatus Aminicenantes bacterium]
MRIMYFFLLIFLLCFFYTCASYEIAEAPIDPNSQKFLDLIRYIVTPQEERIFREMPPEDRHEFVADFWKRRDPDPETAENEFRDIYYTRIARATKAFRAGIPGWMTDRGRIYVLLGPPTDVIKKSMGDATLDFNKGLRELSTDMLEEGTRTERSTQIWVYNQYPNYFSGPLRLVFVDYYGTGDYKLNTDVTVKPFNLVSHIMSDPDMIQFQTIGEIEEWESSPRILPFLDYSKALGEPVKDKSGNITIDCFFEVPLGALQFRKENEEYIYDIELSIMVQNIGTNSTYEQNKEIKRSLSLEDLRTSLKNRQTLSEVISVPLENGANNIYFSLRDNIRQKRLRKLDVVNIK